jgi:SAM-dependent methyltransferase
MAIDSGPCPPIPPKQLRFMGETGESFLSLGDEYAGRIGEFVGAVGPNYQLVDVGCGYGRLAYGLLRTGFGGRYFGFDVLGSHIAWLKENFRPAANETRFTFEVVNLYNQRYNPHGKPLKETTLPSQIGLADCICALSVFTHMYGEEIEIYFEHLMNFLNPRGKVIATFFCLADDADPFAKSAAYPLTEQRSPVAYIHKADDPLLVIAFRRRFLEALFARHRLRIVKELKGRWYSPEGAEEFQDWFFLERS